MPTMLSPSRHCKAVGHWSLNDIRSADRATLIALWRSALKTDPPKKISMPLLRQILAFEVQARNGRGLPRQTKAALKTLTATQSRRSEGRGVRSTPTLQPGTRLLRDWNGHSHVVDVVEDGFLWRGQSYASLSAVARAITGAHWSGPRFFGLVIN